MLNVTAAYLAGPVDTPNKQEQRAEGEPVDHLLDIAGDDTALGVLLCVGGQACGRCRTIAELEITVGELCHSLDP